MNQANADIVCSFCGSKSLKYVARLTYVDNFNRIKLTYYCRKCDTRFKVYTFASSINVKEVNSGDLLITHKGGNNEKF